MHLFIYIVLGGATVVAIFWVWRLWRIADHRTQRILCLETEKARLETTLDMERKASEERMRLLHDNEARFKEQFENLANRILEEKGKTIGEQQRERMSGLLQPLKEQLEAFRKRVDEVHEQGTAQSARLIEQVRQLQELSNKVSDEANHLAKAIKGDSKTQGDWGELIVERIFEASGLTPDREYEVQPTYRDEDGQLKRPDFLVKLTNGKAIIVDSKVSLKAYEQYVNASTDEERQAALKDHVQSLRRHIAELDAKDYTGWLGNNSLDFVLMCVPLEPAYQTAMQADMNLWHDTASTRVVLTGPTTLMITLKLIAQIWRRENENRNAERIADRAGRLYDQVALIAEAMQSARSKLGSASDAFDLVMRRLKEGRGNLINRVEELRSLGAKVSKQLPDTDPAEEEQHE